ncbi:MAG: hypothetical protein AB1779_04430 [Candidatus Thermoplasmatota archaeon]
MIRAKSQKEICTRIKRYTIETGRKFKRIYWAYRNKNIEKKRFGYCNMCGKCCSLPFKCLFYSDSKKKCLIYRYRFKPCKVYPARESDLVEGCGYWFEKSKT